jgi:release factor glutamine methyltransferase
MNAIDKIKKIAAALSVLGIESPETEAEIMVRHCLNIDPVKLYGENPELSKEDELLLHRMVQRRAEREPLQYIIGDVDFMGLKIEVSNGVLIPRPETELMAEYAIKKITNQNPTPDTRHPSLKILDLCTGSGCLALALAKGCTESRVIGCDSSEAALEIARRNALINEINNVKFLRGDLFGPLSDKDRFDMIISNPPYIKTGDIQGLQPEIKDWEPLQALDGGADGLEYYRMIIPESVSRLRDGGILMFEHGDGQSGEITSMLDDAGFEEINIVKDYSGQERVIEARWTK